MPNTCHHLLTQVPNIQTAFLDRHTENNLESWIHKNWSPNIQLQTIKQIHSNDVLLLDNSPINTCENPADGIMTTQPRYALAIKTADCLPILLADKNGRCIAAVHAGWRGTVNGILQNCIRKMNATGITSSEIVAVIGPSISWPYFQVGEEVYQAATQPEPFHGATAFFKSCPTTQKYVFDLSGYARAILFHQGVLCENLQICTYENPQQFFSHRYCQHNQIERKGYGQYSVIALS